MWIRSKIQHTFFEPVPSSLQVFIQYTDMELIFRIHLTLVLAWKSSSFVFASTTGRSSRFLKHN